MMNAHHKKSFSISDINSKTIRHQRGKATMLKLIFQKKKIDGLEASETAKSNFGESLDQNSIIVGRIVWKMRASD